MLFVSTLLARARSLTRPASPDAPLSLNRQLFSLAWPALIENLLQTMLGVVDLIFVGQLGADAIAGVGLGNLFMFLLLVTFMGLAVGNTALVARAIGAQEPDKAAQLSKQSLLLAVLTALPIGLVGYFFSDAVMGLMGATPVVSDLGAAFLRVTSTFSIFISVMLVASGSLRGAGDMRTPMLITGIVNVINIILDYALIFGNLGAPKMGAVGSAYATTIARGVGAVFLIYVLFSRNRVLKIDWRRGWQLHRETLARLFNIGGPAAGENLIFQLGVIIFSRIVVGLGTAEIAAQNVAFNINSFSILPAFAFGSAALTIVGQSLGAHNVERAQASAQQALRSGLIWMTVMGIAFVIWRNELVSLYTQDAEVIAIGSILMLFVALAQPPLAIAVVLANALRGAGDTRATLVITFVGIWLIRLLVGYFFGIFLGWGLYGVWIGWFADFGTRAFLVWWRWRSEKWKTIRV